LLRPARRPLRGGGDALCSVGPSAPAASVPRLRNQ